MLLVVVCKLVSRAYEQDLVPPRLHGLAGVALAAAAVLRPDHHPLVLLDVAAQLVGIVLVFDRQLDVSRDVLVDLDKTVLLESHERFVDGELDVLGSVEPPAAYALLPAEQLSSGVHLALPYSEGVRLDGIYVDPVVGQELVGVVEVEVVVLHKKLLDVSEAVCQGRLRV